MNIDNKTLREAQLVMLETLVEVDRICRKYNIRYWLVSGTLLGAVRHEGFIPWDDDLDIAMPLEDYNIFLTIAQKELPENMFLQTHGSDPTFPYDFAKIRNSKGKIIEKHERYKKITYNQGIFIDIFPSITIRKGLFFKYLYRLSFLVIKLFSYKYLNQSYIRRCLIKIIDRMNQGTPCDDCKIIWSAKLPSLNFYIDYNAVYPLRELCFEGRSFHVPNNYNEVLRVLFGDNYLKLPHKKNRKTHNWTIELQKQI